MLVKPKYRLGQKIILISTRYVDGKYDVGYIVGVSANRSYQSAGIFQTGGLSCYENERKGLLRNYVDHIDNVTYEVVHQLHTIDSRQECRREKNVPESGIVPYTKENRLTYPVAEYKPK